jgi:hypothetical protein
MLQGTFLTLPSAGERNNELVDVDNSRRIFGTAICLAPATDVANLHPKLP